MREIKFRAWDKVEKKMGEVRILDFVCQMVQVKNEKYFAMWEFENIELLQFTGLKDKNGVDIYEGDILEVNHHWDDYDGCSGTEKFLGVAIFKEGAFQVSRFEKMEFYLASSIIISNEIKGNVYENPELMEG